MFSSDEQFSNASLPILQILSGRAIVLRATQSSNIPSPISIAPFLISRASSLSQPLKMFLPTLPSARPP